MARQIRIERKSATSRGSSQVRTAPTLDLRTPSGRKLPY